MLTRCLTVMSLLALLAACQSSAVLTRQSPLAGNWVLNEELTKEEQPDGPRQRGGGFGSSGAHVSVGGVPLPGTGGNNLPSVPGSAPDPDVLRVNEMTIEPVGDDELRLVYAGAGSETLERGDDQGLVSHWGERELDTRYETTSRTVSQNFEVRGDGRLLVTVRLNPNNGPTVIHKRVFDPAP